MIDIKQMHQTQFSKQTRVIQIQWMAKLR